MSKKSQAGGKSTNQALKAINLFNIQRFILYGHILFPKPLLEVS
jgi:hypothetical protein